jgi:hypothetical protein
MSFLTRTRVDLGKAQTVTNNRDSQMPWHILLVLRNAAKPEIQIAMPSSISRLVPPDKLQNLVSVLRNDALRNYVRKLTESPATKFQLEQYTGFKTCIEQMYKVRSQQ